MELTHQQYVKTISNCLFSSISVSFDNVEIRSRVLIAFKIKTMPLLRYNLHMIKNIEFMSRISLIKANTLIYVTQSHLL